MADCFVTKLKSAVQNDNLFGINSLQIATLTNSEQLGLKVDAPVTIKAKGGTFRLMSGGAEMTEYTLSNLGYYVYFIVANKGTKVEINSKYNILGIDNVSLSSDDVKFMAQLEGVTIRRGSINDFLGLSNLSTVNCENTAGVQTTVDGDVSVFNGKPMVNFYFSGSYVTGDIAQLGTADAGEFEITGTKIYGTIESFISNLISNNNPNNPMLFLAVNSDVTFGGLKIEASFLSRLAYESASRFMLRDSVNIDEATIIMCKGYTTAEVTAWQNAGKTVIVRD